MIKTAFITPTVYINKFGSQGDFQLGLSHLLNNECDNDYAQALKNTKQKIVLDNGTFEKGNPEGIGSLLQKAGKIGASVVFAPDYLYNAQKTRFTLDVTIYELRQLQLDKSIKIGAVVQAKDKQEWLSFYKELTLNPDVSMIGLSILAIPYVYKMPITEARIACMKDLLKMNINHKKCHLLGLGSSLKDVIFASQNCPFVYSHDSSSAFWNAMQHKKILDDGDIEGGKTESRVDFNFNSGTDDQLTLAQQNIDTYKKLLKK
jgi:hypothetical protein